MRMHMDFCMNGAVMHVVCRKKCIKKGNKKTSPSGDGEERKEGDPDVAGIGYERPGFDRPGVGVRHDGVWFC